MVRKRTQFILLAAAIFALRSSDAAVTLEVYSEYITVGKTLSNTCTVTGESFVGWFDTNGNRITATTGALSVTNDSPNQYKLTLSDITEQMAGTYTCKSASEEKTYTMSIEFTFDPAVVPNQDIVLKKNSLIECAINGGVPKPTITWFKKSVLIDIDNSARHELMQNGSILIFNVRESDAGQYSCSVKQGRIVASKDFNVSVVDPPKFTQKPISKSATLKQVVAFNCKAEGFPKPVIKWYRNSELTSAGRYEIMDDGTLKISDAQTSDIDEYRCEAINRAGTISATAQLDAVYIPPEINPIDNPTVSKGDNTQIVCIAKGTPTPKPVWKRIGKDTLDQVITEGSSTLTLTNIQLEDAGIYTCEASNSARDSNGDQIVARSDVTLFVESKPVIDQKKSTTEVYSWIGTTKPIKLVCVSSGFPFPDIQINKNNVKVTGTETKTGGSYTLEILVDEKSEMGDYTCVATNKYGSNSSIMRVLEASTPGLPLNLKLDVACKQIKATWDEPANDGGIPIKDYNIVIKTEGKIKDGQTIDSLQKFHTFLGLERQTSYTVELYALNDVGIGGLTIESTVTLFECPPSQPVITSPKTDKIGVNKIKLVWTKSVKNGNDDDITYSVKYAVYNIDGSHGEWTVVKAGKYLEYEITDLQYKKIYSVMVVAKNSGGETPSAVRRYETPVDVPPEIAYRKSGLDGGAVAGIVIAIILIILIVVDLFCCFFNECGFIHCCCQTFFSKGGSSTAAKYSAEEKKTSTGKEQEPLKKGQDPAVV